MLERDKSVCWRERERERERKKERKKEKEIEIKKRERRKDIIKIGSNEVKVFVRHAARIPRRGPIRLPRVTSYKLYI